MFERYTEKARRVIFFARDEAGKAGSDYIEPEHLLLGLVRESAVLLPRFLSQGTDLEAFRREVQGAIPSGEPKTTGTDMPLSHPTKRILAYGAEEAERMNHGHIGTEHLLLGFLRDSSRASRILEKYGVHVTEARQEILKNSKSFSRESGGGTFRHTVGRAQFSTTRAEDGTLVIETHRFHESHELTLIERLKLSDDGKTLKYSQELRGPKKKEHRFEIDFDVS